jgi:FHS family L-fucose permease-like MFS transporter
MKVKPIPVFLAFLCMGFGDAIGPFVGLAQEKFILTNFEAQFIAFAGFIMFLLLAIPIGILQDRTGKKVILLIGLVSALVGVAIPLFGLENYPLFLLTVMLLGAGNAIMQVAGNPVMRDVSAEGKYSRNLVFGQFVKAIGSFTGPLIPVVAKNYFNADWSVLFPIYTVSIFITIASVLSLKVDEKKDSGQKPSTFKSCSSLLKNPAVLIMVLGIFFYVGAEVCMSSGVSIYLKNQFGVDIQKVGLAGTGLFFLALLIGRLSGGIILNWLSAKKFFIVTTVLSAVGILGLFIGNQTIGFISTFVIGLGFANIFPLIFSITVESMPERTNELSGLMVTAIVGGALIPPIMGAVADMTSVLTGFLVPLSCIVYLIIIAVVTLKKA